MSGKYPRAKFSSLLTITIFTRNSRRGPNILQLGFSVRQSLSRQIVEIFREADEDSATLRFFLLPFCQKRGILAHFEPACVLFRKALSSIPFYFGSCTRAQRHCALLDRLDLISRTVRLLEAVCCCLRHTQAGGLVQPCTY